jgi:hypothetical protein
MSFSRHQDFGRIIHASPPAGSSTAPRFAASEFTDLFARTMATR